MALIRYQALNLFNELHHFFRLGDGDLLDRATREWVPAVDIKVDDEAYALHVDVPGVDPKDIQIELEDGVLSIQGERKFDKPSEHEDYQRVERRRGEFCRRFTLPDAADAEKITAGCKDGVLQVRIPKVGDHRHL